MKKRILIGTSGWNYPEWNGVFYPEDIAEQDKLKFYADRFLTVENDSAFYHIPQPGTLRKWYETTPDGFVISVKLNRYFSHTKRLKIDRDSSELLEKFLETTQELKEKLGVILIQTPQSLRFDLERLEIFLSHLKDLSGKMEFPPRYSIEFRNEKWFNEATYKLLKKYKVALTISQSRMYPKTKMITADFLYIRFHGPSVLFASSYKQTDMKRWAEFISDAKKVKTAYIYFNNTAYGFALRNALMLKQFLSGKLIIGD